MGVLGKDLFDLHRPQTNTKVEFGASAYWVEDRPEPQPYGAVLTEILNLDVAPSQELLDQLNTAVQEKSGDVLRAYMDMKKGLASLPLYRLYLEDFRVFGDMPVKAFVVGEAQDAFAEFVMQEDNDLPAFMQQQINDIRLIQERYAWFLDGVFADAVFEKKKGQRKIPLAPMICLHGYEAFISGVSLGESPETDAPPVKTQYRIRGEKEKAEIVEKMYFDRLLDFVYVEFMKGLQKGFVPKRCANCGRWFLQTPGATYAYCTDPAPGQDGKTCREIGASSRTARCRAGTVRTGGERRETTAHRAGDCRGAQRRVIERRGESLCERDSPLASLVRSVLFIMRGSLFTRRISI